MSLEHLDALSLHQFISRFRDTSKSVVDVPILLTAPSQIAWKTRAVCSTVTRTKLTNVWTELECRYDINWATHGAQIVNMTARHKKIFL